MKREDVDKEFLEKYHKMISDVESRPKIFKNLKQGDTIWYLYYSYRGNGKKKSSYFIKNYTVHELVEYCKEVENIDKLVPKSYAIYVLREMMEKTVYSSRLEDKDIIGKTRKVTRPDSLIHLYNRYYGDDMSGDIVEHDDPYCCEYVVVAFDKKKAIKRMMAYVQEKMDEQKKRFKTYIEKEQAKETELEAEYDNILKEIENG